MNKPDPKFKVGDRCKYMYPIGSGQNQVLTCMDDNMVIKSEPEWDGRQWTYEIEGKCNPCREEYLELY